MRNPVPVTGPVEVWMLAVEREMRVTLHALAKEGVHSYPAMHRTRWIEASLGMVGLVGSAIWWAWEIEDAFRRMAAGEKSALKVLAPTATQSASAYFAVAWNSMLLAAPFGGPGRPRMPSGACHRREGALKVRAPTATQSAS